MSNQNRPLRATRTAAKTTLFQCPDRCEPVLSANWPGVTVEKKEGQAQGVHSDVTIMDLPGIYSLSPLLAGRGGCTKLSDLRSPRRDPQYRGRYQP